MSWSSLIIREDPDIEEESLGVFAEGCVLYHATSSPLLVMPLHHLTSLYHFHSSASQPLLHHQLVLLSYDSITPDDAIISDYIHVYHFCPLVFPPSLLHRTVFIVRLAFGIGGVAHGGLQ